MTTDNVPATVVSRRQTKGSAFNRDVQVNIDPWSSNPLIEDYAQVNPGIVQIARGEAPEPELFVSGALPPFTASGVDPALLNLLPYTARHAAASEPSAAKVLSMIEEYGNDDTVTFEHPGLDDYRQRVTRWLAGTDAPKTTMTPAEEDAVMSDLFGEPTQ